MACCCGDGGQGEPSRLYRGTDYTGGTCGLNGRPDRIYYPRITEDLIEFSLEGRSAKDVLDVRLPRRTAA
jgi:hypothetical protein